MGVICFLRFALFKNCSHANAGVQKNVTFNRVFICSMMISVITIMYLMPLLSSLVEVIHGISRYY